MTDSQAGAGHEPNGRPTTVVDDAKLDSLAAQVGALAAQVGALASKVTELLVQGATTAGDVRAILGRMDGHDRTERDHEVRLREIEGHGTDSLADLVKDVAKLKEWKAQLIGLAAGIGAVSGGVVAAVVKAIGA